MLFKTRYRLYPIIPPNTLSMISSTSKTRPIASCVHSIDKEAKNTRKIVRRPFLPEA